MQKLVILDFELEPSQGLHPISLGSVVLDMNTGDIEDLYHKHIALPHHVRLSPYITALTGITPTMLDFAPSVKKVLQGFWDALNELSGSVRLGAWGDDIDWLHRFSRLAGVKAPSVRSYDLQSCFDFLAFAHGIKSQHRLGLSTMMGTFGMEFEGTHHDALADAYNTAKLYYKVFKSLKPLSSPECTSF